MHYWSIITIFFSENGALNVSRIPKPLFPTNSVTCEKLIKRCFDDKLLHFLKALKFETLENVLKHLLWQKWEPLKSLKLKKSNFVRFLSRQLGEKALKDLFWQKWWLLKALKLEKTEKAKFAHFVSYPIGEKYSKTSFDKNWGFWKLWRLKSSKK